MSDDEDEDPWFMRRPSSDGEGDVRRSVGFRLFPNASRAAAARELVADRYRLEDLLGQGSAGKVWRAYDVRDDRTVALKVLRSSEAFAGTGVDRLRREARLLGQLSHPNIVEVLDCGELERGGAYIAMELVHGRPLASLLGAGAPMPWTLAREILLQLADALACAHGQGVIHRDVKPANAMVVDRAGEPVCRLIDFGLACRIAVDPQTAKLTGSGLVFGTPRYMSPEQIRSQPTDARTDIYSLGCVAYEMVTGTAAFGGDAMGDVLRAHLVDEPRRFADVAPGVVFPVGLESVVRRATRRNPCDRFASMEQLRDALCNAEIAGVDVPEEADLVPTSTSVITRSSSLLRELRQVWFLLLMLLSSVIGLLLALVL